MFNILSIFPVVEWARSYNKNWLRPDILAGITVVAFTIPEAIAYASLAGLPPEAGLYSAMIGLLVYVIFGTSRQLSMGPTSALSILIGSTLGSLLIVNAGQYALITSLLAVMVGVFAIISWMLHLGFIIRYISKTVLIGFVAGLALFIASGQLPILFGISGASGNFFQRISYLILHIDQTNLATLVVGVGGLLFLIIATKMFPKLPNTLILVLGSIILLTVPNLTNLGIKVVGTIPQGLPTLVFPETSLIDFNTLIILAVAVFILSYSEGYGVATNYAIKNRYKIDANRELLALGASNVAVGLFHGFPVGGSVSRTAVNNESGAKTPLAGGISGLFILVVLVFFTSLFFNLPETILAAIVIFAIRGLFDIPHFRFIYNFSHVEFAIAILTLLSVLIFGTIQGLIIGIILSILVLINNIKKPHISILGQVPCTDNYKDIKSHPKSIQIPEVLIIKLDGSQIFLHADNIKNKIVNLLDHEYRDTKLLVLDLESTSFIDISGIEMLDELIKELKSRGIIIKAANISNPARDAFMKTELEIGEINVCINVGDCIKNWQTE
ncbi:SulP family inorganic anion transporter [Methanobacterium sp. SMA-27]|uniref:SulP family inorganic anion transporter n=1 Tax=Methanobacterium sp. SMA-27 TaxID=1495336 RepID=UPI00064E9577|nr:sulfate permease [Methanobacterium sp. SMA-27]